MSRKGYEKSDISLRLVLTFGIGLLAAAVFIHLLMGAVFSYLASRHNRADRPASPVGVSRQIPPEPRLQTTPATDLKEMHIAEDAVLESYGWVDRKAGVVRIPIDRAMDLLVRRGVPVRAEQTNKQGRAVANEQPKEMQSKQPATEPRPPGSGVLRPIQ